MKLNMKKVKKTKKTKRPEDKAPKSFKLKRKRMTPHDYLPFIFLGLCIFVVSIRLIGIIILLCLPTSSTNYDTTPPEIALTGEKEISLNVGEAYTEPGATATDDSKDKEVLATGIVDTSKLGRYIVLYTAIDSSGNVTTKTRSVLVKAPARGTIYLTFDDGPGPYTDKLLNILAKYNVKATFFVTCSGDDYLIKREYDEGHTVALHTCTHNYSYIYESMDNYFSDLYQIQNRVKDITGYAPTLIRFPGGSSNTVSALYDGGQRIMSRLASEVTARGFTYFDWNISSGDAGGAYDTGSVYARVINALGEGGSYVILQHDIKGFSVDAVESIIEYGLNNGYSFDRLNSSSFTAHHRINN